MGGTGFYLAALLRTLAFTPVCNDTGVPAMSLPMGSSGGLPVGVHCVAAYGEEALLLRLAAQVEAAGLFVSDYR